MYSIISYRGKTLHLYINCATHFDGSLWSAADEHEVNQFLCFHIKGRPIQLVQTHAEPLPLPTEIASNIVSYVSANTT